MILEGMGGGKRLRNARPEAIFHSLLFVERRNDFRSSNYAAGRFQICRDPRALQVSVYVRLLGQLLALKGERRVINGKVYIRLKGREVNKLLKGESQLEI